MFVIRKAQAEEASELCFLLVQSITELCVADHNNDPELLGKWLANKTPEKMAAWIMAQDSTMLVVEREQERLAVGAVTDEGEITLNYVLPKARFQGVSRALIAALEERAKERGCTRVFLSSTGTARRFYLSAGYKEESPRKGFFGAKVFPMAKKIV